MGVWKVQVVCHGNAAGKKLGGPRKRVKCYMTALVEADTGLEAMAAGSKYVEERAPSDALWEEFLPLSAALVELPALVSGVTP